MAYVLSVGEYLIQDNPQLSSLRKSLLELDLTNPIKIINESFSKVNESQNISHQLYLLENFDTLAEINANENFLLLNNYNPLFLVESGIYKQTLETMESINESFISTLKAAWSAMTEDGSPIGIFQFLLDIIGIVPASWVGFPIDVAANALNAFIYYMRGQIVMCIINLIACFDLSKVFAPLKLGIKAIIKPVTGLFKVLKNPAKAVAAATVLQSSKAGLNNPGTVKMVGQALAKLSKWIVTSGINLIKSILPNVVKAINRLTLGAFKLDAYIPKMTKALDTWSAELMLMSKGAEASSKVLLSDKTVKAAQGTIKKSAGNVGAEAATIARAEAAAAGKQLTAKTSKQIADDATTTILKDLGLSKTATQMQKYHIEALGRAANKFNKLFPNGVNNPKVYTNFINNEATREMVANVLSKKAGFMSLAGNKKVMRALGKTSQWKGADKMLANTIKKGDPVELGKAIQKMLDDPEFFALMSKHSPDVVKTMSLFRHAPEALIAGSKTFADFSKIAVTKWQISKDLVKKLPVFILKQLIKKNPCEDQIKKAEDSDDILTNLQSQVLPDQSKWDIAKTAASQIFEQTEATDYLELSQETLAAFKAENPQGYVEIIKAEEAANQEIDKLIEQTNTKDPCGNFIRIKSAEAGVIINENPGMYKEGYTGSIDYKTPTEAEPLQQQSKTYLKMLGQDTNIDPQHPLKDQDAATKAYFSPVVNSFGIIDLNKDPEVALNEMIQHLIEAGQLTQDQVSAFRDKIHKSWETNTLPSAVVLDGQSEPGLNESIFKTGKLITKQ